MFLLLLLFVALTKSSLTPIATGWELHVDLSASHGDIIYASADYHFSTGLIVSAPRTTYTVGEGKHIYLLLSGYKENRHLGCVAVGVVCSHLPTGGTNRQKDSHTFSFSRVFLTAALTPACQLRVADYICRNGLWKRKGSLALLVTSPSGIQTGQRKSGR